MKTLRLLFFVCLVIKTNAQEDAVKQIELINKAYKNCSKLSMDIEYKMYETYSSTLPIDVKSGYFKKNDKLYHNKIDGFENIITKNSAIYIDSEEKQIVLSKNIPSNLDKQYMMVDVTASMNKYKKVEFIPLNNKNLRGLRFWFKEGYDNLTYFELFYYADTYLIKKLNLYYNVKISFNDEVKDIEGTLPRMEIEFSNLDTNPSFDEKEFSNEYFVKGGSSRYSPVDRYKEYTVSIL